MRECVNDNLNENRSAAKTLSGSDREIRLVDFRLQGGVTEFDEYRAGAITEAGPRQACSLTGDNHRQLLVADICSHFRGCRDNGQW